MRILQSAIRLTSLVLKPVYVLFVQLLFVRRSWVGCERFRRHILAVSIINDHRLGIGCRSVHDDGDVVSVDLLHVDNDAWW